MIDTHAHLYLPEFNADRNDVILRAIQKGIEKIILPNIDIETIVDVLQMASAYPKYCYAAMGLHPCSVSHDYMNQLEVIYKNVKDASNIAIGEIGLDYYWDLSYSEEQVQAFKMQLGWAKEMKLPVIIHVRNSHQQVMEVIRKEWSSDLRGVFHCFSGDLADALEIIDLGFYLGIGGVVTFKNSNLSMILSQISMDHILLETDSPYLAPVPHRGKRNESAYLDLVVAKLSEIYQADKGTVILQTTLNAKSLFGF